MTADENNANEIFLQTHPSQVFKTITINGTDVTNRFTMTEGKTKAICSNYETAPEYRIAVTTESDGRYCIQWAYDDAFGQDALVEHGKVEVIEVDGNNVNAAQGPVYIETGKRVKIRLIPDYGYQISDIRCLFKWSSFFVSRKRNKYLYVHYAGSSYSSEGNLFGSIGYSSESGWRCGIFRYAWKWKGGCG